MKKILVITAFPPNQFTAGQNYTRLLLNSLSLKTKIDLIYFSYGNHEIKINDRINIVRKYKNNNYLKLLSVCLFPFFFPFFTARLRLRLIFYLIREGRKYDIIYFDFSQVFIYSLFIKHSRKILMLHDVIYQKYKRKNWFNRIFLFFLMSTEKKVLRSTKEVYCFSEKDEIILKEQYNTQAKKVDLFINEDIKKTCIDQYKDNNLFCFFAAWNRSVNYEGLVWFFDKVYPKLSVKFKFDIIGAGLELAFVDFIKNYPNVKYWGFLDNPYVKIAEAKALIAPIFQGAGVKVKVLESLALGTNVIGTKIAFEGIDIDGIGRNMLLCEKSEDFIDAITNYPIVKVEEKRVLRLTFNKSYPKSTFAKYI